jgi:hypothetical protein
MGGLHIIPDMPSALGHGNDVIDRTVPGIRVFYVPSDYGKITTELAQPMITIENTFPRDRSIKGNAKTFSTGSMIFRKRNILCPFNPHCLGTATGCSFLGAWTAASYGFSTFSHEYFAAFRADFLIFGDFMIIIPSISADCGAKPSDVACAGKVILTLVTFACYRTDVSLSDSILTGAALLTAYIRTVTRWAAC